MKEENQEKDDIAKAAKKILEQADANIQTLARYHWQLYTNYIIAGFDKEQAMHLLTTSIMATLSNQKKYGE